MQSFNFLDRPIVLWSTVVPFLPFWNDDGLTLFKWWPDDAFHPSDPRLPAFWADATKCPAPGKRVDRLEASFTILTNQPVFLVHPTLLSKLQNLVSICQTHFPGAGHVGYLEIVLGLPIIRQSYKTCNGVRTQLEDSNLVSSDRSSLPYGVLLFAYLATCWYFEHFCQYM